MNKSDTQEVAIWYNNTVKYLHAKYGSIILIPMYGFSMVVVGNIAGEGGGGGGGGGDEDIGRSR